MIALVIMIMFCGNATAMNVKSPQSSSIEGCFSPICSPVNSTGSNSPYLHSCPNSPASCQGIDDEPATDRVVWLHEDPLEIMQDIKERHDDNPYTHTVCLYTAILNNDHHEVSRLVERWPEIVNSRDYHGMTALHYAAMNNFGKIVEILLCHGADVTLKNNDKKMPLNLAVETRSYEAIRFLVEDKE